VRIIQLTIKQNVSGIGAEPIHQVPNISMIMHGERLLFIVSLSGRKMGGWGAGGTPQVFLLFRTFDYKVELHFAIWRGEGEHEGEGCN
jgi:hypothetical protein